MSDTLLQQHDFDSALQVIGFGKFQVRIYIAMAILAIAEGAQFIIYTLTIPVLKEIFDIKGSIQDVQSSLLFVAYLRTFLTLVGSLSSGYFSDHYGRKKPCFLVCLILCIIQTLTAFSVNSSMLIFMRTLCLYLLGFFGPLAMTIMAEITPTDKRGRHMAILAVSLGLGQLFGIFLTSLCLDSNLKGGNWRLLIFLSGVPGFVSLVLQFFFLKESPRYDLLYGNQQLALETIDLIAYTNHGKTYEELNLGPKSSLISWAEKYDQNKQVKGNWKELFNTKFRKITTIICFNWFTYTFIYYGITIFLPEILGYINKQKESTFLKLEQLNLTSIFLSVLSEIMGVCFGAMIIDLKFFGRKNSMIIFYFLTSIFTLVTYIDNENNFLVWATISKILVGIISVFCYQYTSESNVLTIVYPTRIRTTGIGFVNAIGRTAGIVMPFICSGLQSVFILNSYIMFSCLSLISAIVTWMLPYDTTGRHLSEAF